MTEPQENQRKLPRIASHHTVLVTRTGDGGTEEEFARTRSIGLGGCCFVSDEPVDVGGVLELLISVGQEVIRARGRSVYQIDTADGRHEVGVEFVEISDEDRARLSHLFEKTTA